MTESDKRKIEELWLQGYGSTKIADKLGINVNTVKSFCRRHGLAGDRQQEKNNLDIVVQEPRCKCCGSSIAWSSDIEDIGDAIINLREERQSILTEAALKHDLQERIEDLFFSSMSRQRR